MHIRH